MTTAEKAVLKQKNRSNGNVQRNKYIKDVIREASSAGIEGDIAEAIAGTDAMPVKYSTEDEIKDIAFLRSCKLNDANMPTIQQKLKSTVKERTKMVNDDRTNLLERFPYFYAEPHLVHRFVDGA